MKNLMFHLLWIFSLVGLALAYNKFMDRQWVPTVFLTVISASVILMCVWLLQFLNRLEIPIATVQSISENVSLGGPIMMQVSGKAIDEPLRWAVGCLFGAIFLAQYPDTLWKWWLSYPASSLLTIVVIVVLLVVMGQKFERIVADSNGIDVRTEARNVVSTSEAKVAWRDVGAVKMIDYYLNSATQYDRNKPDRFVQTQLVLFDHEGKELLKLDDPLAPPQAYKRYLESIPIWTKLTIQKEKVVNKL